LETADVKSIKRLGGGVSETQLVTLADGSKAVFKPTSGEPKEAIHGNITPGKAASREAAAYDVAKLGGVDDMVAPSALRTVGGKPGVAISFQEGRVATLAHSGEMWGIRDRDVHRAAVFDYVIGNQDRHTGNWLVQRGRISLIDHDLSFPEGKALKGRGINRLLQGQAADYQKGRGGDRLSTSEFKSIARPFVDNRAKILSTLKARGLPDSSIRSAADRIDALGKAKSVADLS
jgi:hypothetical protein